jgi:ABC-2 type transport system ATP-binding protein
VSISVRNISRRYGNQKALDQVSFEVPKGEILGFLGPNGAGKSTMMKILTTFIPPSEGEASVCGFDIRKDSMEVRRKVGYLPEHNPLYADMYVREYLGFIAGLHRLDRKEDRIRKMIELTGLGPEQHKKIAALSKGYRQRVGLAQALIHDPEVLILDEPTSGLDPNQLADIRQLIRNLGKDRTVMFSTHIMQEVEAVCDRVIIINKGKLVADGGARELSREHTRGYSIMVEFDRAVDRSELMQIQGVQRADARSGNSWELFTQSKEDIRPAVFQFAVNKQLTVLTISRNEKNLETVFRDLTKNSA